MTNRDGETPGSERPGTGGDGGERGRLIAERADADRRYNEKLTALDASIRRAPDVPRAGPIEAQELVRASRTCRRSCRRSRRQAEGRWRDRGSATLAWELVGPILARQQAFNTALVQQLKQDAAARRETSSAIATTTTVLRDELEALATFESQLTQYLQQVTPFIDTKMRVLEHAMEELRMTAAAAQHASSAVKREVERLRSDGAASEHGGRPLVRRFLGKGYGPYSTSASRTAFAAAPRTSAAGWPTTRATSRARPTCSTSAAAAASSWTC